MPARTGQLQKELLQPLASQAQAQAHRCRNDYVPCCPLEEALNALPDIRFLHDPETMVPLFGYTGCAKNRGGSGRLGSCRWTRLTQRRHKLLKYPTRHVP
jgi:hypothetical protein